MILISIHGTSKLNLDVEFEVRDELDVERRAGGYRCRYVPGDFTITAEHAGAAIAQVKKDKVTDGTQSGYPHEFQNLSKIKWPNARCNPGMHGSPVQKTYEFPVNSNGKIYDYKKKKGLQDLPPPRTIFLGG